MREFRSPLPLLLHRGGFEVIPRTIAIGDYLLSPNICVERKSPTDLSQSLFTGRLAQQARNLTSHYPVPILLIEFGHNREDGVTGELVGKTGGMSEVVLRTDKDRPVSPSLQIPVTHTPLPHQPRKDSNQFIPPPTGPAFPSSGIISATNQSTTLLSFQSTYAKLIILTVAFPTLRIVWSQSPSETVELFRILKQGEPEPDGGLPTQAQTSDDFTRPQCALAMMCPGITAETLPEVARVAPTLRHLAKIDKEALVSLLGPNKGAELFEFIHQKIHIDEKKETTKGSTERGKKKWRTRITQNRSEGIDGRLKERDVMMAQIKKKE